MEYFKSEALGYMIVGVDFNQRRNSNQLFCLFVAVIIHLRKVLTQDNYDEI